MIHEEMTNKGYGSLPDGQASPEEQMPIERLEFYQMNLHQMSVLKNVFTLPTKPVFPHGNPFSDITDMSIAVSKDLIVTAGKDKYLRVFEYPGSG